MDLLKSRIDIISIFFSTIGFGGIVYGFSSAGEIGASWNSPEVILSVILGIIALILFVLRQNNLKKTMLSMRPFTFKLFTMGVFILTLTMMAMFSSMILLTMFLQDGLQVSPLKAGLIMLPGGAIMGIMSPISGRLFDEFGAKWLARIGSGIVVCMLFIFSTVDSDVALTTIIVIHSIMMFGISILMMPIMTMSLNQLPKELYSHGSAILNTVQQVSGAIGTALLITIMSKKQEAFLASHGGSNEVAMTVGVNGAFLFAAIAIIVAFIISLFLKDK